MFEELRRTVAPILGVGLDEISPQSGPIDVDSWDSLAHITIVTTVEEIYGIQFTMDQILSMKSISEIEAAVTECLSRQKNDV